MKKYAFFDVDKTIYDGYSTSASPNVEAVADYLNCEQVFSSELVIEDGTYTGEILQMLNYEEKMHTVNCILGHLAKNSKKLGFGDSTGDVPMLSLMNEAFVHQPHEEEMKQITKGHGWHLVDKSTMLTTATKFL